MKEEKVFELFVGCKLMIDSCSKLTTRNKIQNQNQNTKTITTTTRKQQKQVEEKPLGNYLSSSNMYFKSWSKVFMFVVIFILIFMPNGSNCHEKQNDFTRPSQINNVHDDSEPEIEQIVFKARVDSDESVKFDPFLDAINQQKKQVTVSSSSSSSLNEYDDMMSHETKSDYGIFLKSLFYGFKMKFSGFN